MINEKSNLKIDIDPTRGIDKYTPHIQVPNSGEAIIQIYYDFDGDDGDIEFFLEQSINGDRWAEIDGSRTSVEIQENGIFIFNIQLKPDLFVRFNYSASGRAGGYITNIKTFV